MQCVMFYGHTMYAGVFKSAGPFRLATALREAGYEVQCVDLAPIAMKYHPVIDAIIDKFVDADTLWVGISTTFLIHLFGVPTGRFKGQKIKGDEYLCHFMDRVRKRAPNAKFLTGGSIHTDLSAYGFFRIDGFADTEIIEFTKFCEGKPHRLMRLGKNITGEEYKDFHSCRIRWEKQDILRPEETLPLEIARGCIFRCKFCAYPLNGKTKGEWVKRPEVLLEELLHNYEQFGITRYMLGDDTYNDSTDKIRMLYDEVFSKLPFKINITSYLRLDLINRFREQAAILRDSGVNAALFGIETNNNASAKAIGKGMGFEKQIDLINDLKANEFKDTLISSGFITGLPFDTRESIAELRAFLLSDKNPVDDWIVRPLALNPVNEARNRKFYSEFDLDHEKYGYEFLADPTLGEVESMFYQKWRLKGDLTSDECLALADEIEVACAKLPNLKYGSGSYARMHTIFPSEEVKTKSRHQLQTEYDIPALERKRIHEYYRLLMEL